MIQTSFLVVFLPYGIYERPILIRLTVFTMPVRAGFIPTSLYSELTFLHALAKDGVSEGFLDVLEALFMIPYGHLLGNYCGHQKCETNNFLR